MQQSSLLNLWHEHIRIPRNHHIVLNTRLLHLQAEVHMSTSVTQLAKVSTFTDCFLTPVSHLTRVLGRILHNFHACLHELLKPRISQHLFLLITPRMREHNQSEAPLMQRALSIVTTQWGDRRRQGGHRHKYHSPGKGQIRGRSGRTRGHLAGRGSWSKLGHGLGKKAGIPWEKQH